MNQYPNCAPLSGRFGSATCNRCCSVPDQILKDLFRGPDPFGRKDLDKWYLENFWPPLRDQIASITNRIQNSIAGQTSSIGGFYEAGNNVRALTGMQASAARTARNYTSSEALCRFATLAQGIGSAQGKAEAITMLMATRSLDRQLLRANVTAGEDKKGEISRGQSADKLARWNAYNSTFCNPADNQGQGSAACSSAGDEQYNRDVNYTRSFGDPLTLDIGMEAGMTPDVQNLNALADNLYAHDVANNAQSGQSLDAKGGSVGEIRKYMLMRSAIAKRAVAENSFSTIAAMKAKGSTASAKATQNLLIELGMDKATAEKFVTDNPSYYAQMEALTKKMYQSPTFYVNLMDGPANVARQSTAMKSLELMQQRDIYQSAQRSEMLMATLLDVYISRQQGGLNKGLMQSQK